MKTLKLWHTVQFKIIIAIAVVFLSICAALIVLNFYLYRSGLIDTLTENAGQLNESIVNSLELAMLSGERQKVQTSIERISQDDHILNLYISDTKQIIRVSTNKSFIGSSLTQSHLVSADSIFARPLLETETRVMRDTATGSSVLRSIHPILNQPACYSCHSPADRINGLIFLDYSLSAYETQLRTYKSRIALLGGLAFIALIGLTFLFLNKLVLKRIKNLVKHLQTIGAGKFKKEYQYSGNDEFAILGDSINQMSRNLQDSFQKISEQRDYLQHVINSVQDGLIVVDNDFRIVLANGVFLKFINKKSDQVLGNLCAETLGREICGSLHGGKNCPSAKALKSGAFSQVTHSYNDKNGQRVLEISASPLMNDKGKPHQSIEIIRDITEKQRLESELFQSEKMAVVGRLAAGVAHEINNPLATISTCTEGLMNRVKENKDLFREEKRFSEYLERIEKCVFRCKNIIERILAFSHTSRQHKETLNLNEVISETIHLILPRVEYEKKAIRTTLATEPILVRGNLDQMSQLVLNIVMNSLDAIENEGQVDVSTSSKNGKAVLRIVDNGIGIDGKHLDRIFEPFFTTKDVGKGTGLGLAICHRIIEEHNGTIKVESAKNKGCEVEITFPRVNG